MRRTILIPYKPFSVNAMYYASAKIITKEARAWSYQIFNLLNSEENQKAIQDLKSYFDPKEHAYSIWMTAFYPESDLFRKEGGLSARAFDQSNWEKPLIDLLFLPKHCKKEVPYGVNNLEVDDKYIKRIISDKDVSPSKEHYIKITISIIEARRRLRKLDP